VRVATVASAAERLAEFSSGLRYEDVPPPVIESAKLHLLDMLGCALAAQATRTATHARDVVVGFGGKREASVVGLQTRIPAPHAAMANGALAHGLDFDDTHADAVCHTSVVVGPAAIATAEAAGASGRNLVTAFVAGSEIVIRLGLAASGEFHQRGLHATSVCGVFGAAAAAARLSEAGARDSVHALGLAGSMASGLLAFLDDGTPTKPLHAGWAAQAGVLASRLAASGAQGPSSVLDGRFGLYRALLGTEARLAEELDDLGERWETPAIAFKAYPACHYMHGVLGAAEELAAEVDPAAVEEVVVVVPAPAVPLVLEPAAAKVAPRSAYEAKFSLQYSVASVLVRRRLGVVDYTEEALGDPDVQALAARVRYETREYETYPRAFPGGVRIGLAGGETLEAELRHQKGAPENPLSSEEVLAKFRANAELALRDGSAAALASSVLQLDRHDDVAEALAPLRFEAVAA
jgi:2-methylcitrate dehydratase PrpD